MGRFRRGQLALFAQPEALTGTPPSRYSVRFTRSDFVECLFYFRQDVKTIEDVKRLRAFLANEF